MRYSNTLLTFEGSEGSHPSEDELEEFVFGRLDGAALDDLEEHLLICEACRRRLTETENFVASTRAAARKMLGAPPPTPKPRRFSAPALALAGVLGISLLVAYFTILPRFRSPQTVTLVAERSGTPGQASSGRPLDLRLDAEGLGSAPGAGGSEVRWLEIVNSQGARLHSAAVTATQGLVVYRSPALPRGQTWIRLYAQPSPSAQTPPLREFNLIVQ
jgi:anti-sigma factor RsiW